MEGPAVAISPQRKAFVVRTKMESNQVDDICASSTAQISARLQLKNCGYNIETSHHKDGSSFDTILPAIITSPKSNKSKMSKFGLKTDQAKTHQQEQEQEQEQEHEYHQEPSWIRWWKDVKRQSCQRNSCYNTNIDVEAMAKALAQGSSSNGVELIREMASILQRGSKSGALKDEAVKEKLRTMLEPILGSDFKYVYMPPRNNTIINLGESKEVPPPPPTTTTSSANSITDETMSTYAYSWTKSVDKLLNPENKAANKASCDMILDDSTNVTHSKVLSVTVANASLENGISVSGSMHFHKIEDVDGGGNSIKLTKLDEEIVLNSPKNKKPIVATTANSVSMELKSPPTVGLLLASKGNIVRGPQNRQASPRAPPYPHLARNSGVNYSPRAIVAKLAASSKESEDTRTPRKKEKKKDESSNPLHPKTEQVDAWDSVFHEDDDAINHISTLSTVSELKDLKAKVKELETKNEELAAAITQAEQNAEDCDIRRRVIEIELKEQSMEYEKNMLAMKSQKEYADAETSYGESPASNGFSFKTALYELANEVEADGWTLYYYCDLLPGLQLLAADDSYEHRAGAEEKRKTASITEQAIFDSNNDPIVIDNPAIHEKFNKDIDRGQSTKLLAKSIRIGNQGGAIGVFNLIKTSREAVSFLEQDYEYVQRAANNLAIALQEFLVREEGRILTRGLKLLSSTLHQFYSEEDLNRILLHLGDEISQICGVKQTQVRVINNITEAEYKVIALINNGETLNIPIQALNRQIIGMIQLTGKRKQHLKDLEVAVYTSADVECAKTIASCLAIALKK